MSDKYEDNRFDVRYVNVLKITSLIDSEILIAECEYALTQIERQRKEPAFYNDKQWVFDSSRAADEIAHKLKLAIMKNNALSERVSAQRNAAQASPDDQYRARFVKAARVLLSDTKFEEIHQHAREMRQAA